MSNGARIPSHIDLVERFCAELRNRPLSSFRRRTFQAWLQRRYPQRRWSSQDASIMLQEHVIAQGDPTKSTSHVLACQGYGPSARWFILLASGVPDHARYAAADIVKRYERQHIRKLYPAALADPIMNEALELATSRIEDSLAFIESLATDLASSTRG